MVRLTTMFGERSDDLVNGKTDSVGVGEYARDEGAQATLVFMRRMGLCGRGADERSDAALGFDRPRPLELGVHARDRVGIDAEIHGELADGRELVAGAKAMGGDCRPQPPFELCIDRRRIAGVDRDEAHSVILVY